jgi:hypothetical protein
VLPERSSWPNGIAVVYLDRTLLFTIYGGDTRCPDGLWVLIERITRYGDYIRGMRGVGGDTTTSHYIRV